MNSIRIAAAGGLLLTLGMMLAMSRPVRGGELSPDEKAFFDKHVSEIVKIEPTRLEDKNLLRVFATPFYNVKIEVKQGEGSETSEAVAARVGDQLVSVSRPSTDADMPDFPKTLNPSFKLKTDTDAKAMQSSLDVLYPIIGDDDKKAETFKHAGNKWTFIRGKFFDHHMGFIFETDASGAIKSAKYSLQIQ